MNRKTTLSVILLIFLMFAGQALADGNLESAQKYFDAGEYKKAVGLLKEVTRKSRQIQRHGSSWEIVIRGWKKTKMQLRPMNKRFELILRMKRPSLVWGLITAECVIIQMQLKSIRKSLRLIPSMQRRILSWV